MKTIQIFIIDNNKNLKIYIPNLKHKINWYYEPTEKLDKFDEVTVTYNGMKNITKIILAVDIISYIIKILREKIKKILNNNLPLPEFINAGMLGYYYNEITYSLPEEPSEQDRQKQSFFTKYWLFSREDIQTWVYNLNNEIYLEIGQTWKWLLSDRHECDLDFIPYEEFIKNYKPIAVIKIEKKIAEQWLQQCEDLLKQLEEN